MIKKFILSLFITVIAIAANAQNWCGTDVDYLKLKQRYPQIAIYEQQLKQALTEGVRHTRFDSRYAKTTGSDTVVYDIPVVVHMLHDYGTEDLNDSLVYNAISNWNTTLMGQNADSVDIIEPFKKYFGKLRIRLHLATKDPNGNPTKGITRRFSYYAYTGGDLAKLDQWPNESYMNIWFINVFGGDLAGAAAYARYPSVAELMPFYDGVMCISSYLTVGTTIPHELGHSFNLEHVWGNTNNPDVACGDDEVDDTPPTKGHNPLPNCTSGALYDTACATNYFKIYQNSLGVDSALVDYPDTTNTQNIMDYAYCSRMFTTGQVRRMRAALDDTMAGRNNLYSISNLAATGALDPMPDLPPVADFSIEKGHAAHFPVPTERSYFLCMDNSTQFIFRNRSWNDTITNIAWTFSNGATTPTYSVAGALVDANLSNQFSQPGWVTISLTATGNHTGTNTLTNTHAVYVADTTNLPISGYSQQFATAGDLNTWPIFNYYNNDFKWEWYNGAGFGDNACLRYTSFDNRPPPASKSGTARGDKDDIFTPSFDLSNNTTGDLNLNFYTAGSYRSRTDSVYDYPVFDMKTDSTADDSMQVFASTNCGTTWVLLNTIRGTDLLNNTRQNMEFIPSSASQWKPQTVSIPVAQRTNRVFFKLRYWPSDNSNNLYLDNFSIGIFNTEVQQAVNNADIIKIFPNPSHGDCKLIFTTGNDGKVSYCVRDITGKIIYQQDASYAANTLIQHELNGIFPSAGMYLVTVTIANKTTTQKLLID